MAPPLFPSIGADLPESIASSVDFASQGTSTITITSGRTSRKSDLEDHQCRDHHRMNPNENDQPHPQICRHVSVSFTAVIAEELLPTPDRLEAGAKHQG